MYRAGVLIGFWWLVIAVGAGLIIASEPQARFEGNDCGAWNRVEVDGPPVREIGLGAAFDPGRNVVVVYGGTNAGAGTRLSDTWEFDGKSWVNLCSPCPPGDLDGHVLFYDENLGQILLLGGADVKGNFNEKLWGWDGVVWAEVPFSGTLPSPRSFAAVAFDRARGVAILFGGSDPGGDDLQDTWVWDGVAWTQLQPMAVPDVRDEHAMVYDSERETIFMYGGFGRARLSDVWEWDGQDWNLVSNATSAGTAGAHGLAYDPVCSYVITIGGGDGSLFRPDTWVWGGLAWDLDCASSPSARQNPGFVYDSHRDVFVLFGGRDESGAQGDTWEYTPPSCQGEFRSLAPNPGTLGVTSSLAVENATPASEVWFVWSPSVGARDLEPRCSGVLADLDPSGGVLGTARADTDGTAFLDVCVPCAMAGRSAALQAIEPDGCRVSRGVRHTFGTDCMDTPLGECVDLSHSDGFFDISP